MAAHNKLSLNSFQWTGLANNKKHLKFTCSSEKQLINLTFGNLVRQGQGSTVRF